MLHATFKGFLSSYILHKYSCRKSTITDGIDFAVKKLSFYTWIAINKRQQYLQVKGTDNSVSLIAGIEDVKFTAMSIYFECFL